MRILALLILGLLVVGCGTTHTVESIAGTYEGKVKGINYIKLRGKGNFPEQEKTNLKSIVYRIVLQDNGIVEHWVDGVLKGHSRWKIVKHGFNEEVVFTYPTETTISFLPFESPEKLAKMRLINYYRINHDVSITYIGGRTFDGTEGVVPKEDQNTFKKIK